MPTYEKLHELFEYVDGELKWRNTDKIIGINEKGYRRVIINGKYYKVHRIIYKMHNPLWDISDSSRDNSIDHRDGNIHNNKIDNLRKVNNSQNKQNMGKKKNNTSGYKGVSYYKPNGKWKAAIKYDKKSRHIGYYDSPEEAHLAYSKEAYKHHGQFARVE